MKLLGDRTDEERDRRLRTHVRLRLEAVPALAAEHFRVDVERGVVRLGGAVGSSGARRLAEHRVWRTRGVVDVSNELVPRGRAGDGR